MKGLRKGVCFLLLMAVASAQSPAVARQNVRQTDPSHDLWLQRARSLTEELVKDSDSLRRYDRALLLGRLGRVWQRADAGRARAWVEQAVEAVESAPDKEAAAESGQRLEAARKLLSLVGAQDKALSARLNKVINAATETAAPTATAAGRENATAKAEAALAVLDRDPRRALQLGLAALRDGGSYKLASLLWRLRKRDAGLGDALFTEVIAAARARGFDADLLALLPAVAFKGPSPSDKLRGSFLETLAEGLLRAPGSAQELTASCRLASLAAPLLPEFQRLAPQQAGMVRAQLVRCQPSLDPHARKEIGESLREQPLNAVEDLLQAAGRTSDLGQRVTYLNRAAYMAFGEQQYDRAISILDGFSSEERESANGTTGGLWDDWRASFAAASAVAHLGRGDRPRMFQIIGETPARLRASVQISVAAELLKKDGPAATQLLDEARAALARAGSPRDFDSYVALVRLYATLNPPDALPVLNDAVKALNRAGQSRQDKGADAEGAGAEVSPLFNDTLLARYALPAALLAADEVGVRQAIASVESPARRAAMRLRLLAASLARLRAAAPEPTTEEKERDHANQ